MDEIERAQALAACHQFLQQKGIEVSIVHNLGEVQSITGRSAKPYLTPLVSPEFNDLTQANSLWLTGIKDGNPVMLGGARLEVVEQGELPLFAET